MPNPVIAQFQDVRGVRHDVVVRQAPDDGAWQVLDISVRRTTVIETLTSIDEGRPEAEAIAREYGRERKAQGAGSRA